MIYSISRFLSFVLCRLLFGVKIHGRENLPAKESFILAGNHTSYLDPVLLGISSPRKLNYMAKAELFRKPLMAWYLSALKVFPVKRKSADLSAIKEAMKRINKGEPLVLFPQGSRTTDPQAATLYPGVGFLAAKLNVPVVPAFIQGADQALPRGAKLLKLRKIHVFLGKQIYVDNKLSYQDIARQIMTAITLVGEDSLKFLSKGGMY